MTYVSDEFGDPQVFLLPLEEDGGRLLVSAGPAVSPVWAPDGSRLYYWSTADSLVEATIGFEGGAPPVTGRRPLFSTRGYGRDFVDRAYDIHPDDDRFVFIKHPPATRIVVVTDWFPEVKEIFGIEEWEGPGRRGRRRKGGRRIGSGDMFSGMEPSTVPTLQHSIPVTGEPPCVVSLPAPTASPSSRP